MKKKEEKLVISIGEFEARHSGNELRFYYEGKQVGGWKQLKPWHHIELKGFSSQKFFDKLEGEGEGDLLDALDEQNFTVILAYLIQLEERKR